MILPDNNPDASGTRARMPTLRLLRLREKQFRRTLPENVEDDLHGLDVRKFNRLQRLLDFFHAHAVMPQFAGFHQVIEDAKNFRQIINSP